MRDLQKLATEIKINHLARKICLYNGQKATEKQVKKCIKQFSGSIELMEQFQKERFCNIY